MPQDKSLYIFWEFSGKQGEGLLPSSSRRIWQHIFMTPDYNEALSTQTCFVGVPCKDPRICLHWHPNCVQHSGDDSYSSLEGFTGKSWARPHCGSSVWRCDNPLGLRPFCTALVAHGRIHSFFHDSSNNYGRPLYQSSQYILLRIAMHSSHHDSYQRRTTDGI